MLTNTNVDLNGMRKRVTEIQGNWSATERRLRRGLPPDIPSKLRDYILAPRAGKWSTKQCS
jgi:hypothetical protein